MSQSQSLPELPEAWTPEPIRAWRVWMSVLPLGLKSVTITDSFWTNEMRPAECRPWIRTQTTPPFAHAAPNPDCMCGYWALKPELIHEPETWSDMAWSPDAIANVGVLGWVEQWGVVDEYEYGYRSERARITALIDITNAWGELYVSQHIRPHRITDYRHRVRAHAAALQVPVVSIG